MTYGAKTAKQAHTNVKRNRPQDAGERLRPGRHPRIDGTFYRRDRGMGAGISETGLTAEAVATLAADGRDEYV